jgi:hypothetical protein
MSQRTISQRVSAFILLMPLLAACSTSQAPPTPAPEITPTPRDTTPSTSTPTPTLATTPKTEPSPSVTATPDPCTGWWCTITGAVYANAATAGNELEGATVTLHHFSYCSPTSGERQMTTGSDGVFEFGEVFLHDTDRIRIQVESEGYEPALWDSLDVYCLYCGCFQSPIEFVLNAAAGR